MAIYNYKDNLEQSIVFIAKVNKTLATTYVK